jgi:YbbR domain-containing protein
MSLWKRYGPAELVRRFGPLLWSPRQWVDALTYNLPLKLLSLLIAFALWSFVNFGERDAEETLRVPLELRNVPSHLMITSPRDDFVEVRVVGPRTLLGRIDRNRLAIPVDLSGVKPGPAVFRLSSDSLPLPRGVRVARITPAQVTLELERVAHKTVPVRLRFAGRLPAHLQLTESKVSPEMVEVSGPASTIEDIAAAYTQPIDVTALTPGTFERELPLEPSGEYVSFSASRVAVQLRVEEILVTREFRRVDVEVRNAPFPASVSPKSVTVTVRGPKRLLSPETEFSGPVVYVDAEGQAPGRHQLDVRVELPDGMEVVQVEPSQVNVTLQAPRSAKGGRGRG